MVDIPERTESHGPVFIYGVEGEQIEEENDAYNDLRYDIGELRLRGEGGGGWLCSTESHVTLHCIGNQFTLHNDLSWYHSE